MNKLLISILFVCLSHWSLFAQNRFVSVKGHDLIAPDGTLFFIRGINLGNWLNPEGYMFLFKEVSSYRLIDQAFKEIAGPDFVEKFWKEFQENYITREDIRYIKQTGMNSVRIPFHYKLFTHEDFMGNNNPHRGFELLDRVIGWCKEEGIYVILDMHCTPGGQTGDNIDDSYGYPWLFENENNQKQFNAIWRKIAEHYAHETAIIGYDLMNEPIAHYFENKEELNAKLEPVYINATQAIREVDRNHLVILGGAQWNTNFDVFEHPHFDDKIIYECHTYWTDTTQNSIQKFLNFREKVNLPMYMGETGENSDEWIGGFRRLLERNNIGWHFWPYKKLKNTSCMVSVKEPEGWNTIVEYTHKDRSSFAKIRENRPSRQKVHKTLNELTDYIRFENCSKNEAYIEALGMKP